MNFYLDFEATQFAQRIIAIGCVTEDGDSFYTLVKPVDGDRVSSFITKLTGLDKETIRNTGLTPEDALIKLYNFIKKHSDGPTFFYTYGTSDKDFLKHTVHHLKLEKEQMWLKEWYYSLAASFIDYSQFVARYFKSDVISLKKAAAWFKGEEIYQNHNALDDASLLRLVALGVENTPPPEINPWAEEMLERVRKQQEHIAKQRAEAAIKDNQKQTIATSPDGQVFHFESLNKAAQYVHDNLLPKNMRETTPVSTMKKRINNAARTNKPYFQYYWEVIIKNE